jgi:hypothetical protein
MTDRWHRLKPRKQLRRLGYDANSSNDVVEDGTGPEADGVVIHGAVAVAMIETGTLVAHGDVVGSDAVEAARHRHPVTGTVLVAGEEGGIPMFLVGAQSPAVVHDQMTGEVTLGEAVPPAPVHGHGRDLCARHPQGPGPEA